MYIGVFNLGMPTWECQRGGFGTGSSCTNPTSLENSSLTPIPNSWWVGTQNLAPISFRKTLPCLARPTPSHQTINNYLIFILVLTTMIIIVMSYIPNVNNIHSKRLDKYIKCIKFQYLECFHS